MINCYSLLSFRFFCFACLPEKSQHLHFLQMKTLLMFIDFYIVNLLPRVSCYVAMWFNSLQPTSGSEWMLALKLHIENSASSRLTTTESSTTEVSQIHQTYPQSRSKCARREEPCWSQEPPGSDSGVWEELQVTEPVSILELCTERRGSWRLSNIRQAELLKDALS